jgi:formate/nitrite transporter
MTQLADKTTLDRKPARAGQASKPAFRFDMLPPPDMAAAAMNVGIRKVQMDVLSTLLLSILAGVFIGFGACFCTAVTTEASKLLPYGLARVAGGVAFCLGLILCVVAGAELFTGNNLIVMAVASRKVGVRWLVRNWVLVYIGNFIGATGLAWLVWQSGAPGFCKGELGLNAVSAALSRCEQTFNEALLRGVLCNVLVCLAVWMCYSARSTTDKILAILFPITAFVTCGFEHCVANMYFGPMGLFIKGQGALPAPANLTWANFLWNNLLPVTIGNIFGGAVCVGLVFWFIYCRRTPRYRDVVR